MTYKSFDIVVVPFPFVDSLKTKPRPALVLSHSGFSSSGLVILATIASAYHDRKSILDACLKLTF